MQTIKPDFPDLPAGFIPVKIGGRPKKEARDAAVFLAKFWRKEQHGETSTTAEKWIVEEWETAGKVASAGISETAHVRASIKRARDRGLNQSLLMIDHATGLCTAVECEGRATRFSMKDGARSWHWVKGLAEAVQGQVKNPEITVHQEVMHKSPVAVAVTSFIQGVS